MTNNDQTAKADAGKLRLTLVEPDTIRIMSILEEYDQKAVELLTPEFVKKTRKVNGSWKGLFICPYCEKEFEANISNVMRGRQKSCGCAKGLLSVQSKGTHGQTQTRLYTIWRHIKERCEKPYCKEYKWYGARGIKNEFQSFEDFRDYALSHGYNDSLTCERIDVNGNYAPGNVTFIPQALQNRNTRRNVNIDYKGLTLCAAEWAELIGMRPDTLTSRIRKGWSPEKAIETVVHGSLNLELVPVQIIKCIRAVRLYGVNKYVDPDNWKRVEVSRYRDAAFRHFLAYLDDPKSIDEESGLPHLWHCACNLAFLCEMESEDWPSKEQGKPEEKIIYCRNCVNYVQANKDYGFGDCAALDVSVMDDDYCSTAKEKKKD